MKFTKINLPTPNRLMIGLMFLIIGIVLGAGITTVPVLAKFTLPKLAFLANKISPQPPQKVITVDVLAEKKQKLEKFSRELTEAKGKDDWEKLYTVVNPADKKWFSIEDMTLLYKKDKYSIVSTEVIVHGVSVSGDTGNVDNTVINCKTKECTGENKLEKRNNDQFVYIDGHWYQESKEEPSNKARQLAAYIYNYYKIRNDYKEKLVDKYGGGQDDLTKIIRTISIMIENDPEYFAYTEEWVEKHKAEASRSNVYVDSPDVIQQPAPIINQPAPIIQQQTSPKHCTSNTIGDYTYTNCY